MEFLGEKVRTTTEFSEGEGSTIIYSFEFDCINLQ